MQFHISSRMVLLNSCIFHLAIGAFTKKIIRRENTKQNASRGLDNERFGSATFAGFMELKQSGNIGKGKRDRQSRTSEPHQRLSEKAITQNARFLIFFFGATFDTGSSLELAFSFILCRFGERYTTKLNMFLFFRIRWRMINIGESARGFVSRRSELIIILFILSPDIAESLVCKLGSQFHLLQVGGVTDFELYVANIMNAHDTQLFHTLFHRVPWQCNRSRS